jgi:hypothetical protein
MCSTWWIIVLLLLTIIVVGIGETPRNVVTHLNSVKSTTLARPSRLSIKSKARLPALANLHPSILVWYPCSWPGGYRLPFPGYRLVFEYFFGLKSGNSQDELATFLGHFLVHRLIAGELKLQSDYHPMVGNLDRPWGEIHRLIMN